MLCFVLILHRRTYSLPFVQYGYFHFCILQTGVGDPPTPFIKKQFEKALPRQFILPTNFSLIVMSGLQAGCLSGKAMTKFITEISCAVFAHKSYPTREEKEHIAIQCIKKYPFLESSCGNGFVSGPML